MERGTKALTMELGKEISEVLGVPINELLRDFSEQPVSGKNCRRWEEVRKW